VRVVHLAIIGLFAGVLSLAPPPAPAQPRDAQPDLESLAGELGLSSAQLGQIRSLVDAGRKQEIALRAEMDVIEVDLRRELTRTAPDELKVASWADKLGALDGAVRKSRILTWVKMRKVLSAAQRRKLASLRGDRGAAVATSPRGKLEVIAQSRSGGDHLTRTDLSKSIAAVRGTIDSCAARHAFAGKAIASIKIPPAGRPVSVSITADGSSSSFRDCLASAIQSARFPRARTATTLRYPFVF
jgi:hypothetical protein